MGQVSGEQVATEPEPKTLTLEYRWIIRKCHLCPGELSHGGYDEEGHEIRVCSSGNPTHVHLCDIPNRKVTFTVPPERATEFDTEEKRRHGFDHMFVDVHQWQEPTKTVVRSCPDPVIQQAQRIRTGTRSTTLTQREPADGDLMGKKKKPHQSQPTGSALVSPGILLDRLQSVAGKQAAKPASGEPIRIGGRRSQLRSRKHGRRD